jgi:hypothetical protein
MTAVAITQNRDDIGEAIAQALDHLGLEPLVRGRLVAVAAYGKRLTFESA